MGNLIEYMAVRWVAAMVLSTDPRDAGLGMVLVGLATMVGSVWFLKQGSKLERVGMLGLTLLLAVLRLGS